jgi:sugar phosphate isomerase/epimerase
MRLSSVGEPHLGYCTNIHVGESWAEVRHNLEEYVTQVKARVCPSRPFGVGLRLSSRAAEELSRPGAVAELRAWLDVAGLYVFTINGFPYGSFHRTRVKEQVYRPDWLEDERLAYTNRLAEILAELLPDGVEGSVSTVPGAFKPRVGSVADEEAIGDRILRHAAELVRLEDRTGKRVALALEPEPFCHVATIDQSVAFFEDRLFTRAARRRFASLCGRSEEALRRHVGLCVDACHLAVEFEDLDRALERIAGSGIRIAKIQVSAGLEVRNPSALTDALTPYAEGVYLHQVTEERILPSGTRELRRWLDLPDALEAANARGGFDGTWRIHFHVPLFCEELGAFRSTQPYVSALLARVRAAGISPHLEVETYTWDVLPEEHRTVPVVDAVARELEWVIGRVHERAPRS